MSVRTKCHTILIVIAIVTLVFSVLTFVAGIIFRFKLGMLVTNYYDPKTLKSEKDINLDLLKCHDGVHLIPTADSLPGDLDLGDITNTVGAGIMILGVIMILFAVFGILASVSKKRLYLLILSFLLGIVLIVQMILVVKTVDLSSDWHTAGREQAFDSLQSNYELLPSKDGYTTFAMNAIMLQGECCGVNGPADFAFNNYTFECDTIGGKVDLYFPPACCTNDVLKKGFQYAKSCVLDDNAGTLKNLGCYDAVYGHITENYGTTIMSILFLLFTWETLELLLSLMLVFSPNEEELERLKAGIRKDVERQSGIESFDSGRKKFVPYAKVSSWETGDPNRIKSTEIW